VAVEAKEQQSIERAEEEYSVKPKRKIPIKTPQVMKSKPESRPDEPTPIMKDL